MQYKLGKRPAVKDPRVKRLSFVAPNLPEPPTDVNWYAAVENWNMLANDQVGNCVEAGTLHAIQQFSTYAGNPLTPSAEEALDFYSKATGYNPNDPTSDQGSYVLGPGGTMQYWHDTGIMCGGLINKVEAFLQITQKNPREWRQGVHLFGGLLTGMMIPESLMAGDEVPHLWQDFSGPTAGGHEVWINGYETLNSGRVYDLVSWGQMYRATEEFLIHCVDEMVVIIDMVEFNKQGLTGGGLSVADLMSGLKSFS